MKKTITIYLLILASCSLMIVYGFFYVKAYSNISDNFKISESKYDFLVSSGTLMDFLKDAESSQRGYLITGDNKYIELYQNAIYRFKQEKSRFNQLIKRYEIYNGNEADFKQIDYLMTNKIMEMEKTIALRKANNNAAAIAIVKNEVEKIRMKQINGLFQKLMINQKFKEVKAKQDIYAARNKFKIFTTSTGIFIFSCLIVIGFLFYFNQKAAKKTENQLTTESLISTIEEEFNLPKSDSVKDKDYVPSV